MQTVTARALILVALGAGSAFAEECSVKPESIEATGWQSVRPGMSLAEARAALETDKFAFEETVKPEPSGEPKLTFACSEWRGWLEFENRFPDVEWRVGKIHFTRQTADRKESERLATEAFGAGKPKALPTLRRPNGETDRREGIEGPHISFVVNARSTYVHVVYSKAGRAPDPDKEN